MNLHELDPEALRENGEVWPDATRASEVNHATAPIADVERLLKLPIEEWRPCALCGEQSRANRHWRTTADDFCPFLDVWPVPPRLTRADFEERLNGAATRRNVRDALETGRNLAVHPSELNLVLR